MKNHAQIIARNFILDQIRTNRFQAGRVIPSVNKLARAGGVSPMTMWKAVTRLKSEGVLEGRKGARVRVSLAPADAPSDTDSADTARRGVQIDDDEVGRKSYYRIYKRIADDIFHGKYPPGAVLPPRKELCRMYHTGHILLRKALDALCEERALEFYKRSCRVPRSRHRQSSLRIVALVNFHYLGRSVVDTAWPSYISRLDYICANLGVDLNIVSFTRKNDDVILQDESLARIGRIPHGENIAGYIFIVSEFENENSYTLSELAQVRKPAAVLDPQGNQTELNNYLTNKNFKFYPVGTTQTPSKKIADHLIARGHRHIAYVTPYHPSYWSVVRLEGMRAACKKAPVPVRLYPFVDEIGRIQRSGELSDVVDRLHETFMQWQKEFPEVFPYGQLPLFYSVNDERFFSGQLGPAMKTMFNKALENKKITAWVCANDLAANIALNYLKEKKINVPADIALAGFDDSMRAQLHRITSYNPDIEKILASAINHILYFETPLGRRYKAIVEIPGVVISRKTTDKFLKVSA
jgi:DNA-binding LacI/PurR family transcriptional regulator/DNA-binding FadR family transcriptional regulator